MAQAETHEVATNPVPLAQQLERSKRLVQWLRYSSGLIRFPGETRAVLVAPSIQLALAHHAALVTLAEGGHRASLLALVRPIFEAYVWSAWTLRIASDDQLRLLAENKLTTGLERRIRALDRAGFFDRPMLADMKPIIDRMDGLVHGGYEHIQYRIHRDGVIARYPDHLIVDALQFADLFAVMALLEGPVLAPDVELGDRLDRESRALLGLDARKHDTASADSGRG
jgi:hypothetical protein